MNSKVTDTVIPYWLTVGSEVYDLLRKKGKVVETFVKEDFICAVVEFDNSVPFALVVPGCEDIINKYNYYHGFYDINGTVVHHQHMDRTLYPIDMREKFLDFKRQYERS